MLRFDNCLHFVEKSRMVEVQLKLLEVLGQACRESGAWDFLLPYCLFSCWFDLSVVMYRLAGQQVIWNSTRKAM